MFPCTKCGACCKSVGRLVAEARNDVSNDNALLQEVRAFPFNIIDGICSQYKEGYGCMVYDNRPDMCNIDKMYYKYYAGNGISLGEYYIFNAAGCNILIEEYGVSPEKKVFLK